MSLGPYASFIVTSYALVTTVVLLLIVWVAIDFRQQKQVGRVEAVGTLPVPSVVFVVAGEGDGIENLALLVLVPPDCGRYRMEIDFRCGFLIV